MSFAISKIKEIKKEYLVTTNSGCFKISVNMEKFIPCADSLAYPLSETIAVIESLNHAYPLRITLSSAGDLRLMDLRINSDMPRIYQNDDIPGDIMALLKAGESLKQYCIDVESKNWFEFECVDLLNSPVGEEIVFEQPLPYSPEQLAEKMIDAMNYYYDVYAQEVLSL